MLFKILITLAALFGFVHLVRNPNPVVRLILAIQILAIGWTWLPGEAFTSIGIGIYLFALLLVFFYGLLKSRLSQVKRMVILMSSSFAFITHLMQLLHYPAAAWVGLSMVIPACSPFVLMRKGPDATRDETGFMFIIAVDGCIQLLIRSKWLYTMF